MLMALALLCAIIALWFAVGIYSVLRLGISLQQGMLYAPFKAFFRIEDRRLRNARAAQPPVIYAVWHRSRIEPALMLCLLPPDTLHILDEASARSFWLDPWRALARTIIFNAHHVFVSRRLARRLRAGGRLAVYLPDDVSPDSKSFRLFRAIARIASNADARIVPIHVEGAVRSPFSLSPGEAARLAPKFRITALEPMTVPQMVALADGEKPMGANAFFDRMLAVRSQTASRAETHEPA
ncbi:2-acyl-glycerophospho-ethanolamine acyltransferase [Chelativorans sp. AA-79]|uniref:2-acyl-glycerophospho-ethanolamine acyltransferase n=1 Tax=Chelativorans sp. AA-79 TaxID=3028735 RepID=UPI0023F981F5|nr:2-acyl-glycerophospho-ethanolamine acyltransferase [Chelativorans sp. AA-79]WEX07642.1 2-acyl-glycerophospho-ethanolamine acyltransferase [Chelativorans sp. AA-79]